MVTVPDSTRVVSTHVVSIEDGGRSDENVTTVVVPDCVIVLSMHVVSQENSELGATDVGPIEGMLVILNSEEVCVTVKDPDATVDPADNCEETPSDIEELDEGNGLDVDRAGGARLGVAPNKVDDELLVLGMLVEGATTEPVKEIIDAAELGLGPTTELVPGPTDEVLPWPLDVSAPVLAEVIIDSEDEFAPGVRVATMLLIELVASIDELLPKIPDDDNEVLLDSPDENTPVLVVGSICEPEPEAVVVIPLGMLADEKDVALVKFESGYGPEVELDNEIDTPAAEVGITVGTLPDVSSSLNDEAGVEITVELGILKGGLGRIGPDGTSELPVAVVRTVPELNTVSDANDAVLLGAESAVELVRVNGGIVGEGPPELVSGVKDAVPFDTGIAVVGVIPVMVVSTPVVEVLPVTVEGEVGNVSIEDETSVLLVPPELAEPGGLLVRVEFATGYGAELDDCTDRAEDLPLALVRLVPEETSETGEVPEEVDGVAVTMDVVDSPLETGVGLMRPDELVAGNGGRLDGVVRALLASDDGPPDSVGPVVATVELGNGNGPVEEPIMESDGPVVNGGPVPEKDPVLEIPGNLDVELLTPIVEELEDVVIASVEKLSPLVRVSLGIRELVLNGGIVRVIEDEPEPPLPEGPVGPTVGTVELVIENGAVCEPLGVGKPEVTACEVPVKLDVSIEEKPSDVTVLEELPVIVELTAGVGVTPDSDTEEADEVRGGRYDPVPDTVSLELLSGKGALDEVLERAVPEENPVALFVVNEGPGSDSVAVEEDPVPGRLPVPPFVGVVELPSGNGTLDDAGNSEVPERKVLDKEPVIVKEGTVPGRVAVSLSDKVELLGGYRAVCELFSETPTGVVVCSGGGPVVGTLAEADPTPGIVSTPVPPVGRLVGPTVGSEEFVIGKGVTSLAVGELPALVFVNSVTENDSEAETVTELSKLKEVFVSLANGTDEFVCGKEVVTLVKPVVSIEELFTGNGVVSLALGLVPGDARVLVIPIEPPAGLVAGAEEFVNGNGAVSVALREVRVRFAFGVDGGAVIDSEPEVVDELPALIELLIVGVVEFIDDRVLVSPALREPVVFVGTDVGINVDSVLEIGVPVLLDWLFVGLATELDVFVNGPGVVSPTLEEPAEPVDSGIDGSVVSSLEVELNVLLSRLLADPLVRADEFVRGNGVVSVALIKVPMVVEIEPVIDGTVENPVLRIGFEAVIVEFESGKGMDDSVLLVKPLLKPSVPVTEKEPVPMLPLKLEAELVSVGGCELGIPNPDANGVEDGGVKLPDVELVNGYRAVELGPDDCVPVLPLPVVKGGDGGALLGNPLDSDVAAVGMVPLADSLLDVKVPRIVELFIGTADEMIPLGVEDTMVLGSKDVLGVGTIVEFEKGDGRESLRDRFVNVRLPLAEMLLSGKLLAGVEDAVMLDVMNDSENVLELSVAELKVLLDGVIGVELPLIPGVISIVPELVPTLEGNGETLVTMLPIELLLGNGLVRGLEFVVSKLDSWEFEDIGGDMIVGPDNVNDIGIEDIPSLFDADIDPETPVICELIDPVSVIEPLALGIEEPVLLAVTGPVSADVRIVSVGIIVSVNVTLEGTVIIVTISDVVP
ncbi:hypothetical protein GQX73_g4559 [Xylaria multiplex]|uniref:Uncharacterized protein n=1 Tax=Xylaria multiplex TaxID=323545 RepID=A0A7C8MMR7_9PEZI|nr:hypothetical protein GQX73_g4559 [Xylaria multiplex]